MSIWGQIILTTVITGFVFLLVLLSSTSRNHTETITVIDRNTALPKKEFFYADAIAVDSIGFVYKHTHDIRESDNNRKHLIPCSTTHWAFYITGRRDFCVTIAIETDDADPIPEIEQRRFCYAYLQKPHKYRLMHNYRILVHVRVQMPFNTFNRDAAIITPVVKTCLRIDGKKTRR